jgi:hypothetical protein
MSLFSNIKKNKEGIIIIAYPKYFKLIIKANKNKGSVKKKTPAK